MKKLLFLLVAAFALFSFSTANATLLGLRLDYPDIFSNTSGVINYDASTNLFTSTAESQTIQMTALNNTVPIYPDGTSSALNYGSYSVGFYVDESGALTGGIAGNDLEIWGKFTDPNTSIVYDGLLVAGEVKAFGWENGTDDYSQFDFLFDVTYCLLMDFYPLTNQGYIGGDYATVDLDNGWDGTWDETFNMSKVKHDTAPVPEPATMLLFGSGLLGLAGLRRKFFKK